MKVFQRTIRTVFVLLFMYTGSFILNGSDMAMTIPDDCNNPLVGKGVVVDDIDGELAEVLTISGSPEYGNAIDGDLSNYVAFNFVDVTSLGTTSLLSVKEIGAVYTAPRQAGFVVEITGDDDGLGLLNADILEAFQIRTYLNNSLRETAEIGGGGPAIELGVLSGENNKQRIAFETSQPFDEIELLFLGPVDASLLTTIRVYYAYEEESGCNHDCKIALTTNNFPGITADTDCAPNPSCSDFSPLSDVIGDTLLDAEATILVTGSAYVHLDIGSTIPAGYDVGFAIEEDGVLSTDLLSLNVLNAIAITTYTNGNVEQTFLANSGLANVAVLTGQINQISFTASSSFNEVRITFASVLGVLNTWSVYFGFVRPDSDLDGVPDCVDKCDPGDDNFDFDGDGVPDDCDDDCMVSAGYDVAACTDGTTAQLTPAPSGFNWSAEAGNPSAASVNNAGEVSGLDAEGVYLFALSNGVCSDIVAVNYFTALGTPGCNDPIAGPGVIIDDNGDCELCGHGDAGNVIDGDLSNYVEDSDFITLAITLGGSERAMISVKDTNNVYAAGRRAGYVVSFPGGLVDVTLLQALAIRTYLDDVEVETSITGGSSVADADALGLNGQVRISFETTGDFDEVELVVLGGIVTAEVLTAMRIFYAFTEPNTCPGGDGDFGDSNCETILNCESSFAGNINYDTTGIFGVACALCDIGSLSHIIDADPNNFATMDLDVGVIGEGSVSVVFQETAPAGVFAGYVIRVDGSLLSAGVLDAFELNTYLGGVLQESVTTSSTLVYVTLLGNGSDINRFGFRTTQPFDEIQFVADANLLSGGVAGSEIDIFYSFLEFDSDGDEVPDCRDNCCAGDDTIDEDGDGVPGACDDGPIAVNDTMSTDENTELIVDVLVNDDFGDNGPVADSIDIISQPPNGTAVIDDNGTPDDPTDDTIVYTPDPNYNGADSMQYAICDFDKDCDTAWIFITINSVLPLELLSFDVYRQGRSAMLLWRTSNEINHSHFEIQRKGEGGDFNNIGTIKSKSDVSQQTYQFEDASPLPGINYYRLLQVDTDGSSTFSPIRSLQFDDVATGVRLYPNPTRGTLHIDIPVNEEKYNGKTLEVYSTEGRYMILNNASDLQAGTTQLDVSQLTPGVYLARLVNPTTGEAAFTGYFVKQ